MTIYNSETGKLVTELDQMISHDDLLDELYPMVTIGIFQWEASRVLLNMDPVAYDVSLIEHVDQMVESGAWYDSDNLTCEQAGEVLCGTDACVCA
jgi:hypothetical protein